MTSPPSCPTCGVQEFACKTCGERIVFVPKTGFGNTGQWKHTGALTGQRGRAHLPHPELVIT